MKHIAFLVALSVIATAPETAAAQSLAEVAKQEEARRKAVKVPGKVYTNSDLKPDPSNTSTPQRPGDIATVLTPPAQLEPPAGLPMAAGTLPGGKVESTGTGLKPVPGPDEGEAHWRALITGARAAVERSKLLADALQSRLNALATDLVNRDDPAQRAQLELERQRALAELARMKTEIAEQTKSIAEIEEDARKAGIPPGWLR